MQEPAVTSGPTAYLDTCIISALVKNDVDAVEQRALDDLIARYDRGEATFICSEVVDSELAKIPENYKGPHLKMLALFRSVPRALVGGVTRMSLMGTPTANPRHQKWQRLIGILPDEEDAWHVFVASENGIKYLVTVDQRTMLSRADTVLRASGVQLVRPSEFLRVFS
jgi:hypothetical protein